MLADLRGDVTYPGDPGGQVKGRRHRPPCPITTTRTDDTVWIPECAQQGWVIITRDRQIQHYRAELEAVRRNAARMVALAGNEAGDTWHQLEVVMCQWRQIESLVSQPGPFIYTATRTALRPVAL